MKSASDLSRHLPSLFLLGRGTLLGGRVKNERLQSWYRNWSSLVCYPLALLQVFSLMIIYVFLEER